MERVLIKDLGSVKQDKVLVKGWIHKIHNLGSVNFLQLRDKSGIVQIVIDKENLNDLRIETSIEVLGTKVFNEKAPQGIEIQAEKIKIVGKATYEMMPFEINKREINAALEVQLDNRVISLRKPKIRAIFKIQEEIEEAFRKYLKEKDFSQVHTPKIIDSSTEGGSEMFTVDYFGSRAFLAQSPQFYKQMMVGAGFERVYEIGHAYRAEPHNTWRHLSEYVSLDVEMGFIEDENDIMDVEKGFLQYLFKHLKQTCKKELEMYGIDLKDMPSIPRIPLAAAQAIILEKYDKKSPVGNLDAEGEKLFSKYVKETYNSDFVFLTQYPISKRPMYTLPHDEIEGVTRSFDLIYKGLEITTGGQRIHEYDMLIENIKKFRLNPEDFKFYTDFFQYGMPPHGGFAIGLERLTMKILDLQNIREAALLPRDLKRMTP
ncbi:aspartate--tRNA(Asn) ligase [Clostridium bovifaecis]|uniref:Aspartate--tRNA(Asp/Asn) ligase n=1 Tax=Clostridium bovifaecis TaxID=2184719 RepID=A0A6I6EUI1_9CLOT|nr:aspartate--tRNA(Asn) ligase [Clostridium bovifaecis]